MSGDPFPVRFGIIGCANIARKVSSAILLSPNSTIVAIGSRSLEKANAFAKDNNFPPSAKAYGSYDAVLDDPDVDAVYIPLPTSLHLEWAVSAAKKKKHVLIEKPVALNVKDLDQILAECESSGVQFMDGTMWMHHPRTEEMKKIITDSKQFGEIKEVSSHFSFDAGSTFLKNDIRVKPDLDALGALGDAGWYGIRAILWAFDYQIPKTVTASSDIAKFNEAGVIIACGASLNFPDGKSSTFSCSFVSELKMEISVYGENGSSLRVHDFVGPFQENVGKFHVGETEYSVMTDLPQEALMVKEFSSLVGKIKENGVGPEKKWPIISRKTQAVVDAVKESIGKGFVTVEVVN